MNLQRYRFALFATVLVLASVPARAKVIVDITQAGPNVVASGGGTLDLTDLTSGGANSTSGTVNLYPPGTWAFMGPTGSFLGTEYGSITGPSSYGSGGVATPTSGSGDFFGLIDFGPVKFLDVSNSYVSGSSLSATDIYAGQTIAGLGLTPGTYTWTWGTGPHADSFTIAISATSVPEPASATIMVSGAVAFAAYGWSRHRREQRRQLA